MSAILHIQPMAGVRPQAFVSQLEVKSILRGRSRVLGGIPGADRDFKYRQPQPKVTTTETKEQPKQDKPAVFLRFKH